MKLDAGRRLEKKIQSGGITPSEAAMVRDYLVEVQSLKGIGDATALSQLYQFFTLARIFHENGTTLDSAGTIDYLAGASSVRAMPGKSANYKKHLLMLLKLFAVWGADKLPGIDLVKIAAIKTPAPPKKKNAPEKMLSKDEVLEIIAACHNSRDRALIATLYDGSNRPIELLSLNWGDLHFDEHGAWFATNRKTGKFRRIRLTLAVPYLAQWQADYPGGCRPEVPIFCSFTTKNPDTSRLTKQGLDGIVSKLKKRTGIEKLHPYSFRQSRITHDVADGYDLQYIMMKNWGSVDTKMLEVYTNLSDDYVDSYALERAGMISPVAKIQESKKLLPVECPHCYTINTPGSGFCSRCGLTLTAQAASEIGVIDRLDSQTARDVVEYLQELINSGDLPQPQIK